MHSYSNSFKNRVSASNAVQVQQQKTSLYSDLFATGTTSNKLDSPGGINNHWGDLVGGQTSSSSHSNYASHGMVETPPQSGLTTAHQPLQIADQISRMLNGKLSLTHNSMTPIPLGNIQETLFSSEYIPQSHMRPNEYFDSVQKFEKDSKFIQAQQNSQLLSQQQSQQLLKKPKSAQVQSSSNKNILSQHNHSIGLSESTSNGGVNSAVKANQKVTNSSTKEQTLVASTSSAIGLKSKKQLTINTAEVQSTYSFPHGNSHQVSIENVQHSSNQQPKQQSNDVLANNRGNLGSAKPSGNSFKSSGIASNTIQKSSSMMVPKTTKNVTSAPPSKSHAASTNSQQGTVGGASIKSKMSAQTPTSAVPFQLQVSQTSSQSAIMKQLSPKYQQQIKFYDGVQNLFASQQQQIPSNSQSPSEIQKNTNISNGAPADPFFLSPKHPKSQPQSTKSLAKTSPKCFEFPVQSQLSTQSLVNRNTATTHQSNLQAQMNNYLSNSVKQQPKGSGGNSGSSKVGPINLILQKQQQCEPQNGYETSAGVAKSSAGNTMNIAPVKISSQQKSTFQQISTRDTSEVFKLQQQQDLNAIFVRTQAVLRNFQQEKELWLEEKNAMLNEIQTLRNKIWIYQDNFNQLNQVPNTNSYFENRNIDFND